VRACENGAAGAGRTVSEKWDGPGKGLDVLGFAPVEGDPRLWRRRQRWPCGVWIAAQKSLIRHRAGWPAMSTGFPDSGGHAPAQLPLRVDVVAATPPPGPPITEAHRPGPSSPRSALPGVRNGARSTELPGLDGAPVI